MKRAAQIWLPLFLLAAASSTLSAQQSIYMLVDSIKGSEPAPHVGEFKLNSVSSGVENSTTTSVATGTSVGKAAFSPVKVSMRFNPSSTPAFFRFAAAARNLGSIEIRHYNSTRLFYKTVYDNVILTNVTMEGSDEVVQQIDFVYSRVRWFAPPDPAGLNPPVQVSCWDIPMVKAC